MATPSGEETAGPAVRQTETSERGQQTSQRYPENLRTFLPEHERSPDAERFNQLREEFLLDYGYNTARAYWGDLEHIHDWATERGKDVLALSERDVKQYCALLRRRKYSESTVRRRVTALRALYVSMIANPPEAGNESLTMDGAMR